MSNEEVRLDMPSQFPITQTGGVFQGPPQGGDYVEDRSERNDEKRAEVWSLFTGKPATVANLRSIQAAQEIGCGEERGVEVLQAVSALERLGFKTTIRQGDVVDKGLVPRPMLQVVLLPWDADLKRAENQLSNIRSRLGGRTLTVLGIERPPAPKGYHAERSIDLKVVDAIRDTLGARCEGLFRPFFYSDYRDVVDAIEIAAVPPVPRGDCRGCISMGGESTKVVFSMVAGDYVGFARDFVIPFRELEADIAYMRLTVLTRQLCQVTFEANVAGGKAAAEQLLDRIWSIGRSPEEPCHWVKEIPRIKGKILTMHCHAGPGQLLRLLSLLPKWASVLSIDVHQVDHDGYIEDVCRLHIDERDVSPNDWSEFETRLSAQKGRNGITQLVLRDSHNLYKFGQTRKRPA